MRSLMAALIVLSGCAAEVVAGSDEWEDIEDIVDPGAVDEETWEEAYTAAIEEEEPDVPDDEATASAAEESAIVSARSALGETADPCETKDHPGRRLVEGTNHSDELEGHPGADIIFGYGGDDIIRGLGGSDIICAGFGRDRVWGDDGDDYIDLGPGNDIGRGGRGGDTMHGGAGSDVIRGSWGNDFVFGDLLDDHLFGGPGADLVVGGHGKDWMHGGSGRDFLRGDTNRDLFDGGSGRDTASFMTSMPPGQSLDDIPARPNGIVIIVGQRVVSGDGAEEHIRDVETVIGSAFDDYFRSGDTSTRLVGGLGNDGFEIVEGVTVVGGAGVDTCNGAHCEPGAEVPDGRTTALAYVDARRRDTGLVVLGAPGNVADVIDLRRDGQRVHVVATGGPGIAAGSGCDAVSTHEVSCGFDDPLLFATLWGGEGNDILRLGDNFPRDFTSHVGGGSGSDRLIGGNGRDVLFTGVDGEDYLDGAEGDDALIGESPLGPAPLVEAYTGGGDRFIGGPDNDQIVSDYPCGGHSFEGGSGLDIAGFARVGTSFGTAAERRRMRIFAQLGGAARERTDYHGAAYQPDFCARRFATRLDGHLEILEGAGGDDILHGNGRSNFVWGWGGEDALHGDGRNDVLMGLDGDDRLFGDDGVDRLRGGKAADVLHAQDGARDGEIDCGPGGGTASRDQSRDPEPTRCGTSVSSVMCAGASCRDATGREICQGDRGVTACAGGTRICTCTASGFSSCTECIAM